MESTIVHLRISEELNTALSSLRWATNRSDAIRTILEAFAMLSEQEQVEFLQKSLVRKFEIKNLEQS